jgi:hypothetical protein
MKPTVSVRALATFAAVLSLMACSRTASNPAGNSSPAAPAASVKLAVNQASYNFPTTLVGQVAQSSSFELSATGNGSLVITSITSSNPAEFALTDVATCTGATLVGGSSSCLVSVTFQPAAPGVRSSKIVAASTDGGSITVDVSGTALANSSAGTPPGDGGGGVGGGSGGGGTGGGSSAGSFRQAPCVPNGTTGIVLTLINTTTVPVQLTMTGPVTVVVSLQPGDIQQVAIPPGNYSFTGAMPSAPNANFVPSAWAVVGGCDYLLQVLTVSQGQIALTR